MNRLIYALELLLLLPLYPFLSWKGKKLREQVQRLPQHATYLSLTSDEATKKVLIIGESTAAGVGASSPETTFATRFFTHGAGSIEVLNLGKNGLRAEKLQGLLAKEKDPDSLAFDQVIILIGANDCFKFTPPEKFRKELFAFVHMLEQKETTHLIFIPTIPPVHHFPAIPPLLRLFLGVHRYMLNKEIKGMQAQLTKLHFYDWGTRFSDDFFASDGIHPSDIGYEKMASEAFEQLKG